MLLTSFPKKFSEKLGIKPDTFVVTINPPDNYMGLLSDLPPKVRFVQIADNVMIDTLHIFVRNQQELIHELFASKPLLKEEGALWIFYPKKSSRIRTDLDFNFLIGFANDIHLTNIQMTEYDLTWTAMEFRINSYVS
jgi:hypothetical protein